MVVGSKPIVAVGRKFQRLQPGTTHPPRRIDERLLVQRQPRGVEVAANAFGAVNGNTKPLLSHAAAVFTNSVVSELEPCIWRTLGPQMPTNEEN